MLDDPARVTASRDLIHRAYVSGDLKGLHNSREMSFELLPEVARALYQEREARWLPQLVAMMNAGVPLLVVVGANHLPGSDGLLATLQNRGEELIRIQ